MDQIKACMAALREAAPAIDILENEPMSRHTTFAIGGPADLFVQPKTADELTAALHALRQCGVTPLLLGNGSNMLVSDAGVRGAVVCTTELDEVRVGEDGGMMAEAGALLGRVALWVVLIAEIVAGGAVYVGLAMLFRPEGWREVRLILAQGLAERFRR